MATNNSTNNVQSPNSPQGQVAPLAVANLATGGNIGTAATTVNINSSFILTQTTAAQDVTLPDPTDASPSRLVVLQSSSSSTVSFTFYGVTVNASDVLSVNWDGAAWSVISPPATVAPQQWVALTASQSAVSGEGYYVTSGSPALTLPVTASAGTLISITLTSGGTAWSIVQGAGQGIQFGSSATTVGAGGSLASSAIGDTIHLLCTTADDEWTIIGSIGNITIV